MLLFAVLIRPYELLPKLPSKSSVLVTCRSRAEGEVSLSYPLVLASELRVCLLRASW